MTFVSPSGAGPRADFFPELRFMATKAIQSIERAMYPRRFLIPALALFGAFFFLPLLGGAILALTNSNAFSEDVSFIGLENFGYLFKQDFFGVACANTVYFTVVTTLGKTLFGLLLALALNAKVAGRDLFRALFYLPAVLSSIVIGIMFSAVFRSDGLVNSLFEGAGAGFLTRDWLGSRETGMRAVAAMEIWKWSGFNMAVFLAGLQGIPESYYEAARMDGASAQRTYFAVTLPLLLPAVSINMTSNLIGGLRVFEQVLVLTGGGPGHATQVLNTIVFGAFGQGYYGRASAMSTLLIVVTLICGAAFYRTLSKKEIEAGEDSPPLPRPARPFSPRSSSPLASSSVPWPSSSWVPSRPWARPGVSA